MSVYLIHSIVCFGDFIYHFKSLFSSSTDWFFFSFLHSLSAVAAAVVNLNFLNGIFISSIGIEVFNTLHVPLAPLAAG